MCKSYPSGRTPWRRPPPLCVAWRSGSLDCWSRWRESSILELHPVEINTKLRQDTSKHRKLEFYIFCCHDMFEKSLKSGMGNGSVSVTPIRIHNVFRIRICIIFRIHIHHRFSDPFLYCLPDPPDLHLLPDADLHLLPDPDLRHILDPDQHLPWIRNCNKRKLQPLEPSTLWNWIFVGENKKK